MIYRFHKEIAKEFGLKEAAIFYHISYWVKRNEEDRRNYRDGAFWVYESVREMAEDKHDYLSEDQIRRAINHLVNEDMLIQGNYNRKKYDRTYWYTLSDKGWNILRLCEKETVKSQFG